MDFAWSPELIALGERAAGIGRMGAVRRPFQEDGWLVGHDRDFALELAEHGWLGMTWPTSVGGGGRSALERFVVFEALIASGAPMASCYFADRQIGPTLLQFGTPEQQVRWLPGILAGQDVWCVGLSEPDAGSDVASLRTRAVADPSPAGGWRVSGTKVWTSGAAIADWCYLVARTDPDARPHAGLSEFVVEMSSPGIEVSPITDATGDRHFCEVRFDDVQIAPDHLIGELNGSFGQVMRQMEHERGGIDRLVSNHRLYLDCLPYADTHDPRVRQELAAIETGYRLGRLLVLREVLDQAPRQFSAAAKTACTEHEQRVAALCGRILGAAAQAWVGVSPVGDQQGDPSNLDHLAARVARNIVYAPAYTLMGGTTQILRTIVADRTLGLPRA